MVDAAPHPMAATSPLCSTLRHGPKPAFGTRGERASNDNWPKPAEQFLEEGLFGDIPERLQSYIDYVAIAPDLIVE